MQVCAGCGGPGVQGEDCTGKRAARCSDPFAGCVCESRGDGQYSSQDSVSPSRSRSVLSSWGPNGLSAMPSRRVKSFVALLCVATLTMLFLTYTYHHSSRYLFRFAFGLSESLFPKGPCSCSHCLTEGEDDWFDMRFNQSVPPLMSRDNCYLSDHVYRWWLQLQGERNPANFSEVLERLFEIIPGEELYADSGLGRCRTCAVVGNSGNLQGSYYGKLIDTHHFIMRMNHAPTRGYEKHVGNRTTHHFMYPESARDLQNTTSMVLVPFKTRDLQWITRVLNANSTTHKSRKRPNKDKVLIYSPTFFKYVYDVWLERHGRYPSTGFLALIFALHVCDQVSVFGFGADHRGYWHHYWEKNSGAGAFRATGVHDADFEYNVTLLLADKDKIKMFRGT